MQSKKYLIFVALVAFALLMTGPVMAQDSGATIVEMSTGIPVTIQVRTSGVGTVAAAEPVTFTVEVDSAVAITGTEASVVVDSAVDVDEDATVQITIGKDIESDIVVETIEGLIAENEIADLGTGSAAEDTAADEQIEAEPAGPIANRNANLRGGPGTNYAIVGGVQDGQALVPVGTNDDGSWYTLDDGSWIAAFLVDNAPVDLPVVEAPPAPTPAPVSSSDDTQWNPATVIEETTAYLALYPNDADAYLARGIAHYELNNIDSALSDLNKAIQINTDLTMAYSYRGLIYLDRSNYANAVQEFNQAIQREPNAEVYAARGFAHGMQGNVDQAIQDMERALQLGVNDSMRADVERALRILRGQ